jgi:glutathione peroxidase
MTLSWTILTARTPLPLIVATIAAAVVSAAVAAPVRAQPAGGQAQPAASPAADRSGACPPRLDRRFPRRQDDAPQDLCRFAGQVLLVVNTASRCGYTGQYEGLEKLHARYASHGLVVLGFPSNDFGNQEPGTSAEIAALCFDTYGVKFPMFARSPVSGARANPLFADLARISGQPPRWNFHKYLVSRDGRTVAGFASAVDPLDRRLLREIERLLKESP